MSCTVFVAFTLVAFSAIYVQAVSIFDGLAAAGASKFALFIQSEPALVALYTSPQIHSVFAPTDSAVELINGTDRRLRLRTRQSSGDVTPGGDYQCSDEASSAASLSLVPGQESTTNLNAAGTRKQVVVSHGVSKSTNSTNGTHTLQSRQQPANPIRLFSGLGNNVSIIKTDTPFDGGLIQTVDGFFTIPVSFSSTFNQTNITGFGAGLQTAGLGSIIDNPAGVTVFSTTNDAFQEGAGNITSPTQLSAVLSNHIIPNFLGFLPSLKDGQVLTTQAGTTVTVHIINGEYFIDDAQIVSSDLITSNGVSHVLNKILTPTPPVFTGSGWSMSSTRSTVVVGGLSLLLALAL